MFIFCLVQSYYLSKKRTSTSGHRSRDLITQQLHHCEQGSSKRQSKAQSKAENSVVSKTRSSFQNIIESCLAFLTFVSKEIQGDDIK